MNLDAGIVEHLMLLSRICFGHALQLLRLALGTVVGNCGLKRPLLSKETPGGTKPSCICVET